MTQEPKMTIHHALAELKLIHSQIIKLTDEITFVLANKHSNTKIRGGTKEEFKVDVQSKYDRLRALIARHRAIKAAILASNATTKIVVCGETVTVAEALYMKNDGVGYLRIVRDRMSRDLMGARAKADRENADLVDFRADQYVGTLYSKADMKNTDPDELKRVKNDFIASQTVELIDPVDSVKELAEMNDYLDKFETELDAALSVSNATTFIEVSY